MEMAMGRERVSVVRVTGETLARDVDGAGAMSEGLVAVKVDGLWGYLDAAGRGVIPPRFAWAGDFHDGLAPVRDAEGRCGYVDRRGALAIPARYRSCAPFSEGRALVDLATAPGDADRPAFLDTAGAVVIEGAHAAPPFQAAGPFSGGLAPVGQGGPPTQAGDGVRLGYVDRAGRTVWIPTE
jgi:hypothetical protein